MLLSFLVKGESEGSTTENRSRVHVGSGHGGKPDTSAKRMVLFCNGMTDEGEIGWCSRGVLSGEEWIRALSFSALLFLLPVFPAT